MTDEEIDAAVRRMLARSWFDRVLDRLPGWPDERQWVTLGLFALAGAMLQMAVDNPKLWDVKLFEILIQAVILTGVLNMVLAFHFAANKGEREGAEKRAETTAKAFDAIKATADARGSGVSATASDAADEVAGAAADKAADIKGE